MPANRALIRSFMPLLAAILFAAPCRSEQEIDESILAQPGFREFQRNLRAAWVAPSVATSGWVRFVVGNECLHSGNQFASGQDWLALACIPAGCRLASANLALDLRQEHPSMQRLRFGSALNPEARIVAWFRIDSALPWLRPEEVATYYDGSQPPKPARGTEEARIALPGGALADLVPLLAWRPDSPSGEEDEDATTTPVLLQLRADGKRQLLPGLLSLESFDSGAPRYLLWAGDLDRDGRPDYLVRFAGGSGPIHLYLSSIADAGELVGLAGVYNSGRNLKRENSVSE
jgi:hypothetical protein